ncbi:MAG: outer membrane protein transport protein [Gammaproteobacteria bacterium]|nr:outer membrane protein transport protein [Gammaproteobacteria bacterium]
MLSKHKHLIKFAALPTIFLSSYAFASGIQLDTSYSSAGYAWAGRAALHDDASTGYYNPAIYSTFCHPQIGLAPLFAYVNPDVKMLNAQIDASAIGRGIIPTVGNDRASIGGWNILAGLHAALPLPYHFSLGLNVATPWGLSFEYPRSSKSRYFAQEGALKVVDIDPGISFEAFRGFSIGAGLDAIYTHFSSKLAIPKFTPAPANDTYVTNKNGDKWSYGWNAGLLYRAPTRTEIGVGYHSKVSTTTSGTSSAIDGASRLEFDGRAYTKFVYPEFFNVSVTQALSPCWTFLADIRYTNWSSVDKNVIKFSGDVATEVPTIILPLDWKDSFNFAVGVAYKPTEQWKLKAGFGYDETPIPSDDKRPFLIPDNNRYVIGLGAQYYINPCLHWDAGYTMKIVARSHMNGKLTSGPIVITSDAYASTLISEFSFALTWDIA